MTTQQDAYLDGMNNYDELEHQVNNVIAGKAPNSFDFQKILKNPLVYLGATFSDLLSNFMVLVSLDS